MSYLMTEIKHQANLIQCCSRPEEFLVELKKTNVGWWFVIHNRDRVR
jgi:hypothetical protein